MQGTCSLGDRHWIPDPQVPVPVVKYPLQHKRRCLARQHVVQHITGLSLADENQHTRADIIIPAEKIDQL
ncbi:hypothetical protein D3C75_1080800 [compost metagenome]